MYQGKINDTSRGHKEHPQNRKKVQFGVFAGIYFLVDFSFRKNWNYNRQWFGLVSDLLYRIDRHEGSPVVANGQGIWLWQLNAPPVTIWMTYSVLKIEISWLEVNEFCKLLSIKKKYFPDSLKLQSFTVMFPFAVLRLVYTSICTS